MNRKSLLGFGIGVLAFAYFLYVREYPFRLALMMGAALMVLSWAAIRTWDGLRAMSRRDED